MGCNRVWCGISCGSCGKVVGFGVVVLNCMEVLNRGTGADATFVCETVNNRYFALRDRRLLPCVDSSDARVLNLPLQSTSMTLPLPPRTLSSGIKQQLNGGWLGLGEFVSTAPRVRWKGAAEDSVASKTSSKRGIREKSMPVNSFPGLSSPMRRIRATGGSTELGSIVYSTDIGILQ